MTPALSPNTQAILLLTAPLIAGRGAPAAELLTPGEYKRLARHLRELQRQPADLIAPGADALMQACQPVIDAQRLSALLARGFLMSQAIERWQARAIWVVSRADPDYPRRLKVRLQENAPALLYGCGDVALLRNGGLAVVGSRDVDDALIDYTQAIGRLAASAGCALVSGGARGIDQAAMRGALEAGGAVTGVLADSLEKAATHRDHRQGLLEGRLVLVSPFDPGAGFNVGNAMQRNKLIYALADVSLVVNADEGKGGTWAGAVEQLDKLRFVPVYVRSTGGASRGLDALRAKGAVDWPGPETGEALLAVVEGQPVASTRVDDAVPGVMSVQEPGRGDGGASRSLGMVLPTFEAPMPAAALFAQVRELLLPMLATPMKVSDVAAALEVSPAQARAWLQRLVEEGVVEACARPAGFVVRR